MTEDADLRLLPPRTRLLARRIGLPALMKLSRWRGGVSIYVPAQSNLHRHHDIARCIGWDAAQKLADKEGRRLEVPMCNQAITAELHAKIREYRRGHSERDTALHFEITDRWVRYLMSKAEPEPTPQNDLFERHG